MQELHPETSVPPPSEDSEEDPFKFQDKELFYRQKKALLYHSLGKLNQIL